MRTHEFWADGDYEVAMIQRHARRDLPPIESPPAQARSTVPVIVSRDFVSGCAELDVPYSPFDPGMPVFIRRQAE